MKFILMENKKMNEISSFINQQKFTATEILEIVDVDVAKFQYWIRKKLTSPTIPGYGRGKFHLFGKRDIFYLGFINLLDKAGFDLEMIEIFLNANKLLINCIAEDFEKQLLIEKFFKDADIKQTIAIFYKTQKGNAGWWLTSEKKWKLTDLKAQMIKDEKEKQPPIITIVWLFYELVKIEKRIIENILFKIKYKFNAVKKKGAHKDLMSPAIESLMLQLEKILDGFNDKK